MVVCFGVRVGLLVVHVQRVCTNGGFRGVIDYLRLGVHDELSGEELLQQLCIVVGNGQQLHCGYV